MIICIQINCLFDLSQANVVCRDNAVSNGVIHVIDELLIPPQLRNVYQAMAANERPEPFKSFVSLLQVVGLDTPLQSNAQGYTVLAPSEGAIALLRKMYDTMPVGSASPGWVPLIVNETASTTAQLFLLRSVLAYHIMPGHYYIGGSLASRRKQAEAMAVLASRFVPALPVSQILHETLVYGSAAWQGNNTYVR